MRYLGMIALLCLLSFIDGSIAKCVDSISSIISTESFRDERRTATYTLCPNTIFFMSDPKSNSAPGETRALQVRKSNIHIKCGDDGSSTNNCIFAGGAYQLRVDRPSTLGAINNVIVEGVTFHSATENNVVASASGAVSLKDCIFKNNDNNSVIVTSPPLQNQNQDFGPSLLLRISDSVFLVRSLADRRLD